MVKKLFVMVVVGLFCSTGLLAEDSLQLVDFSAETASKQIKASVKEGIEINIDEKGISVVAPIAEKGYPGVSIKPVNGGVWDCSAYAKVGADITNHGKEKMIINMRVDNPNGWKNKKQLTARTEIPAGKTKTIFLLFGYNGDVADDRLNPAEIAQLIIFTSARKTSEYNYTISNIRAFGEKGEKPVGAVDKKIRPAEGVVVDFTQELDGNIIKLDAKATKSAEGLLVTFTNKTKRTDPGVAYKLKNNGIWDLSQVNTVYVDLKNSSEKALPVSVRLNNNNYNKNNGQNAAMSSVVLEPNEEKTLTIPFVRDLVWDGDSVEKAKSTGFRFDSSEVVGVVIYTTDKEAADGASVLVKKVYGVAEKGPAMPEWLGKRPPVDGDWEMTFEDNFDGDVIDDSKWLIPNQTKESAIHPNFINNSKSWWGRDNSVSDKNISVRDGKMVVKCELKNSSDIHKDNENLTTRYVTSVAGTFGKFTQKYGYWECRMKVPNVRGMWPAFWTMPDRGEEAGIWWKRTNTSDGGMEFDIMEHLGRFGPYKTNIAIHWDGYEKNHKAVGTQNIYFYTDDEGFMTAGMLWESDKVTFYINGNIVGIMRSDRVCSVNSYILITMPVGGWGSKFVDDELLPAELQLDYIRVWQKK